MCYTKKTGGILTNEQILDFIDRYDKVAKIKTITFCGGEVFTLTNFPNLINELTSKNIFIQIITNGTVDRLDLLNNPNSINIIVSIDGSQSTHDKNRGIGNYVKSVNFLTKAKKMGFHTEVFTIATKDNDLLVDFPVTYHLMKPNKSDFVGIFPKGKTIFPPKDFNCKMISLMSNGVVYSCCENWGAIGGITDDIKVLIDRFKHLNDNTSHVTCWTYGQDKNGKRVKIPACFTGI